LGNIGASLLNDAQKNTNYLTFPLLRTPQAHPWWSLPPQSTTELRRLGFGWGVDSPPPHARSTHRGLLPPQPHSPSLLWDPLDPSNSFHPPPTPKSSPSGLFRVSAPPAHAITHHGPLPLLPTPFGFPLPSPMVPAPAQSKTEPWQLVLHGVDHLPSHSRTYGLVHHLHHPTGPPSTQSHSPASEYTRSSPGGVSI
jgi:hypothetical protein